MENNQNIASEVQSSAPKANAAIPKAKQAKNTPIIENVDNSLEAFAQARKLNITPRKARLIVNLVRNHNAQEAIAILKYCQKLGAYDVIKVIKSAIANGVNNQGMKADLMYIKTIFVSEGPTLKRMHPRARGRSGTILKRSSHITVILAEKASSVKAAKKRNKGA